MPTASPPLVAGPYRSPRVRPGHTVACLVRGEVEVDGVTEGVRSTADGTPLAWPYVEPCPGTGKRSLLLVADLVKAVRAESAQAVARCWGVSRWQVTRWRRALGVGRMTAGTRARWAELRPGKLTAEAARAGAAARNRRRATRPEKDPGKGVDTLRGGRYS